MHPYIKPYEGSEPYIFVSYCHADKERVYPVISKLQQNGFRIWFDQGIHLGSDWPDVIAEKLENSSVFLPFLSENATASHNCKQELNFANSQKKPILPVFLEEVVLTFALKMVLASYQALYAYKSDNSIADVLAQTDLLQGCKGEPPVEPPSPKPPVISDPPVIIEPPIPPIVQPNDDTGDIGNGGNDIEGEDSPTTEIVAYLVNPDGVISLEDSQDGIIGRDSSSVKHLIDNKLVSGQQARILCLMRRVYITDLSKHNTTFVNGDRLEPYQEVELYHDDVISFNGLNYRLEHTTKKKRPVVSLHTISFLADNGETEIAKINARLNEVVDFPVAPEKPSDEQNHYRFSKWSLISGTDIGDDNTCRGDAVYHAVYDAIPIEYTVCFLDDTGTVLREASYLFNAIVELPGTPTKPSDKHSQFIFRSWKLLDGTPLSDDNRCKGSARYQAEFTAQRISYTVKFLDEHNTVLAEVSAFYGDKVEMPQAPQENEDGDEFAGWDLSEGISLDNNSCCCGSAVYIAQYEGGTQMTDGYLIDSGTKKLSHICGGIFFNQSNNGKIVAMPMRNGQATLAYITVRGQRFSLHSNTDTLMVNGVALTQDSETEVYHDDVISIGETSYKLCTNTKKVRSNPIPVLVSETGERIPLESFPLSLGRSHQAFMKPNRMISHHHAQIDCRNGEYYLSDNSLNGTYINGDRLESGQEANIVFGDQIMLANICLKFILEK